MTEIRGTSASDGRAMIGMNEAESEAVDRLHRQAGQMKKKPKEESEFQLLLNDIPKEIHKRAKELLMADEKTGFQTEIIFLYSSNLRLESEYIPIFHRSHLSYETSTISGSSLSIG